MKRQSRLYKAAEALIDEHHRAATAILPEDTRRNYQKAFERDLDKVIRKAERRLFNLDLLFENPSVREEKPSVLLLLNLIAIGAISLVGFLVSLLFLFI